LIGEENDGGYRAYHFDYRGSTVALTDKAGQVIGRFQYGPYGALSRGDATQTPFLFNGAYGVMTDGNGLYDMRARFYSPQIRRFVNRDVLLGRVAEGQSLNRFGFVMGNPVSFVDPFGLEKYCGQCALGAYDCLLYSHNLCEPSVALPKPPSGHGVYHCRRPVNIEWIPSKLRSIFPYHHWIKTEKYEAGMGGECPVPGQNCSDIPYSPTETKNHSGQSEEINASCKLVPNIDEECVNDLIMPGRSTGAWTLTNQCQTFVKDVINECSKQQLYSPPIIIPVIILY